MLLESGDTNGLDHVERQEQEPLVEKFKTTLKTENADETEATVKSSMKSIQNAI